MKMKKKRIEKNVKVEKSSQKLLTLVGMLVASGGSSVVDQSIG
jgi:hypothetical protein